MIRNDQLNNDDGKFKGIIILSIIVKYNSASVCASQHTTEPVSRPGKRGRLASGRASGRKTCCSKTPLNEESKKT